MTPSALFDVQEVGYALKVSLAADKVAHKLSA